jgi:O-antigen ligase
MLFGAILNIHNGRKRQSFRLGLLGLLLLALLLTSKRAHLGIIVITLLAMFALTTHSGKLFKGALIAALSSVALLVAQSTIPGVQDALSRFTLSLTEANDINELTTGRVVLWQEAIAGGNSKPLTGKGWGTFNHVWGNGDSAAHAHNALLQVFYALGYPGLIYFVILVVATLTITIQRTVRINRSTNTPPPRKATANAAFGVVFFLVVYACTTGTLLDEAFTYAPFLISISATLVPYPQSVKD